MGTRADFYVGRGEKAEWLGSIGWDGYPTGVVAKGGRVLFHVHTEAQFRAGLDEFLRISRDATTPDQGWPWPWDDSGTTDFAYAFDDGVVYACSFGSEWFVPTGKDEGPENLAEGKAVFPNMKARANVTLGQRSGLIVIQAPKQ